MSIALRPSEITLPPARPEWPTVYAFLCDHFHRLPASVWQQRLASGKVHWWQGEPIDEQTPYRAGKRVCYYREVVQEPVIAEPHQIVLQHEHLLIACKPHGLPVIPGGEFVNECLLERLRQQTGLHELVPVHRLDKDTAGLVVFATQAATRARYSALFAEGRIHKRYRAVAEIPADWHEGQQWQVRNRLEKANPRFVMQVVPGEANAHSSLRLLARQQQLGLFELEPHTGKTHQLRLHMSGIGAPLLADPYYPTLLPKQPKDPHALPLQLLAYALGFIDPVLNTPIAVQTTRQLAGWPAAWPATDATL